MNKLSVEKRTQILTLLVEGCSLRATSRIADVSINTVTKLLVDAGQACQIFHDQAVMNVTTKRVQCDEIWSFCYAKKKNVPHAIKPVEGAGDVWTWTGIDPQSKLIISWYVGDRSAEYAVPFMEDLASRLSNRVQLTTDGHRVYLEAVENAFEWRIDYAMLIKQYGKGETGNTTEAKYSPNVCTGMDIVKVTGEPEDQHICTSHVERQNLTMRMHIRRFTRLTNGFSKKVENHAYAVALHFVYYNFCKIHKTIRCTPAMEAGLTKKLWDIKDIVKLIEDQEFLKS